jgi:hypothetical protein
MSGCNDVNGLEDIACHAEEIVAKAFEEVERLSVSAAAPATPPHHALTAAAMGVHQSVEVFLAVREIVKQEAKG